METITPARDWAARHAATVEAPTPGLGMQQVAEQLLLHRHRTGTSWVPTAATTPAGHPLGVWLHQARSTMRDNTLTAGQRRALIAAGLVTDPAVQALIDTVDHLAEHRDRAGRTAPLPGPDAHSDDGFPLGAAVSTLTRLDLTDGEHLTHLARRLGHHYLNTHRIARRIPSGLTMPNLYGYILDHHGPVEVFRQAHARYVRLSGSPDVPYDHVCADGTPLGSWFEVLASTPQRATLPGKERTRLEHLHPHIAWAVRSTAQARTTQRMLVRLELHAETGTDLRLLTGVGQDSPASHWLREVFPTARVTRDEARRFTSLGLRNDHIRRLNRTHDRKAS